MTKVGIDGWSYGEVWVAVTREGEDRLRSWDGMMTTTQAQMAGMMTRTRTRTTRTRALISC